MSQQDRLPLAWLMALLFWFSLTASGRIGNADASIMLDLSRALLHGSVEWEANCPSCAIGVDDIRTSPYGLATSVWWVPFVLFGRAMSIVVPSFPRTMWEEFFVSFANVPVMSLLLAYLALAWRRVGASAARVHWGLLLFAFATPIGPYAKLPFSDPLFALAVFAAWFHWTAAHRPWLPLIAGGWLGVALLSRRQADAVVPVLLLLWLVETWRNHGWARFGLCLLGVLPALMARLVYNAARFGSPWLERLPGLHKTVLVSVAGWETRLGTVLFSDRSGLLVYGLVPLLITAFSLRKMLRVSPKDTRTLTVMLSSGIAFLTALTFGPGISFGPRYAVYLLAFLGLAWPHFTLPKHWTIRAALTITVAFSVWLMAGGTALDVLPVTERVRLSSPSPRYFKALTIEWRRVLSPNPHPDLPLLEASPAWSHDAFERPDFWWCHLWARWQRSTPENGSGL